MPWQRYIPPQQPGKVQQTEIAKVKEACVTVKGGTTADCTNTPVQITALRTGAIAKIPVVLAELTLQLNIDAIIDLPEYAKEIKNIKKHIKITQCLLLQDTNMLFIKGFIRKNIEYATGKCSNAQGICGDIRHCTVDVPFSCTTPVTFNGILPLPVVPSTTSEFSYFKKQNLRGHGFAEKDHLLSSDMSEFNQISTEYYNELPYCELVSSRIVEFDEYLNPVYPSNTYVPVGEKKFKSIEEKAVVSITVKLLQNRQVAIPAVALGPTEC